MIFVWTLGDVVGLAFAAVVFFGILALWISTLIRQGRCKHDGAIGETSACDAICSECGKNLGFIGDWRKSRK